MKMKFHEMSFSFFYFIFFHEFNEFDEAVQPNYSVDNSLRELRGLFIL